MENTQKNLRIPKEIDFIKNPKHTIIPKLLYEAPTISLLQF